MNLCRLFLFSIASLFCFSAFSQEFIATPESNESNPKNNYQQKSLKTGETIPDSKTSYKRSTKESTKIGEKDSKYKLKPVDNDKGSGVQQLSRQSSSKNSVKNYPTSLINVNKVEKKSSTRTNEELEVGKEAKAEQLKAISKPSRIPEAFVPQEGQVKLKRKKTMPAESTEVELVSKKVRHRENLQYSKNNPKQPISSTHMPSRGN